MTDYLDALERLMILEEQPAFNVHLRSSRNLRTTPHRHLVDPSLAAASLMYFHTDHHEIDIHIQRLDEMWGAIESKLGGEEPIEQGAESLLAAAPSIDLEVAGTPALMAVVTATGGYAYRRDDGVCRAVANACALTRLQQRTAGAERPIAPSLGGLSR